MGDDDFDADGVESGGRTGPRLALLVVIAVLFGAFVLQNTQSQKVDWLIFDFSLPLWALLLLSAIVGVVVRDLIGWIRRRRD